MHEVSEGNGVPRSGYARAVKDRIWMSHHDTSEHEPPSESRGSLLSNSVP